jgi:hypothetical protein
MKVVKDARPGDDWRMVKHTEATMTTFDLTRPGFGVQPPALSESEPPVGVPKFSSLAVHTMSSAVPLRFD